MNWNEQELLQVFLAEARENLAVIEEGLLVLEQRPDDGETLDSVFRAAHTIKGGAATVGLAAMRDTAHSIEDIFDALRAGRRFADPATIGSLLEEVDTLRSLLPDSARRTGTAAPNTPARRSGLRVPVERLDRMLDLAGEINVTRSRVRHRVAQLPQPLRRDIVDHQQRLDGMFAELQELIMRSRLVPLDVLFRQFGRTVRDSAEASGKRARLLIEGDDIEIDTRIADLVKDPLIQIVRNAVGHGIEPSGERLRLGKSETGTVRLRARRESPAMVIEVSDDGRGFDHERILRRARELGVVRGESQLSDEQLFALVFTPGFSTADHVTGLSGRGFGMDIVQKNITSLRGSISIISRAGAGATISIRLPLTLSVIAALPVAVSDEIFVFPLDSVIECMDLPPLARDSAVITLHGETLPIIDLSRVFNLPAQPSARQSLMIVNHSRGRAGMVVDQLFESMQAVVKPLGKLFSAFPFIAGSTVLSTGKVALILDVDGLVAHMKKVAA